MKQAILIFAWQRPEYLRVCIDSIAAAHGFTDWDIIISTDGDPTEKLEIIWPSVHHKQWPDHVGNLWHVTRSIEWAFSLRYDRILFCDCDVIFRRDTFVSIPEKSVSDLFITFVKGDGHIPWFSPFANLVYQQDAIPLLSFVSSRKWIGRPRPGHSGVFAANYPGYDAVYCRYMIDANLTALYSVRSYVAHIGVCGVDNNAPEIHDELFAGSPDTWLTNAIRGFNPSRHPAFVPEDFVYD